MPAIDNSAAPKHHTLTVLVQNRSGVLARVAGCPEIVVCTPCGKDGGINPALLYAARAAGATEAELEQIFAALQKSTPQKGRSV